MITPPKVTNRPERTPLLSSPPLPPVVTYDSSTLPWRTSTWSGACADHPPCEDNVILGISWEGADNLFQDNYRVLLMVVHEVYPDCAAACCPTHVSSHQASDVTCYPREVYSESNGLIQGVGGSFIPPRATPCWDYLWDARDPVTRSESQSGHKTLWRSQSW